MSKEEFLKIRTCVLKVNIHCDGCKKKVKKILQKIEGVYTAKIDSELGRVIVSGNVDPDTLIKKLTKNGKHAELWGAPKANNHNNQNQMQNQFKNLQINNGKGGNNKGQGQKGGGNNQSKGGQNPQLQQMKGFQDLKMPLGGKDQNQKSVKFNLPEDDGMSDDDFDEFDDEFDYDDDDFDDDMDDASYNKMNPMMGNRQMPNMMMYNMNGHQPQLMEGVGNNGGNGGKANKGGGGGGGGGGGNIPVQMNHGGGKGGANGGKKGGNGNNNGGNQNQGGGGKGGKNGGGGQNKNGNNFSANGGKKGGGMNDGPHGVPKMMAMSAGGGMGPTGNAPMNQMGHMSNLSMGQMSNLAAAQGLPAPSMTGAGGGAGSYQGAGHNNMPGNPYNQQQVAAMMMNQQRANGNERFQPMMYTRPPPAVNYMSPYPPYPYPPPPGERFDPDAMFSDENTSSCAVM